MGVIRQPPNENKNTKCPLDAQDPRCPKISMDSLNPPLSLKTSGVTVGQRSTIV